MVWAITQVEPILALTVQIFFNDLHAPSALVRTDITWLFSSLIPSVT